jgi:hypothetical protein
MKNIPTIQELRQKFGCKIKLQHKRFYTRFNLVTRKLDKVLLSRRDAEEILDPADVKFGLLSHGGQSEISILFNDGREYSAIAQCSKKDPFSRSIANKKLVAKALHGINLE